MVEAMSTAIAAAENSRFMEPSYPRAACYVLCDAKGRLKPAPTRARLVAGSWRLSAVGFSEHVQPPQVPLADGDVIRVLQLQLAGDAADFVVLDRADRRIRAGDLEQAVEQRELLVTGRQALEFAADQKIIRAPRSP